MPYHQIYYFFRCYHCGEWFYSNKVIKVKKCWKCTKSFQFKHSTKFTKKCTTQEAITLIKSLKENGQDNTLNNLIKIGTNIYGNFKLRK